MARSFNKVDCALLLNELERTIVIGALRTRYVATESDEDASHERHLLYELLYALGVPPGYEKESGR